MQHHADGVTTMKLSYTGTQQDAAEARANARAFDSQGTGSAPPSLIRDHTGSGVENIPEHAPSAGKVGLLCVYLMALPLVGMVNIPEHAPSAGKVGLLCE